MIKLSELGKSPEQIDRETRYSERRKKILKKLEDENAKIILWLSNAENGIKTPGDKRDINDPHEIAAAKKYIKLKGLTYGR